MSIGASSGWYEGMLSVFTDSVEFTIQDIFPLVINEREMAGVVNYYSSIRDSPQTNTFKMVVGTADHTGLPEGELYDKIMIKNAYHEFTKKWSMLHQLKQHLKPDGKLILTGELFSNKYYTNIHPGCEIRSSRTAVVIDFFAQQGLYPVWLHYPLNSFDNDLIFSLDKAASDAYMKKISRCDSIILQLDLLYNASYAKNPVYLQTVEKSLLQNMTTLLENYDTLDVYLSDIGSVWNERGRYELAVQILELSNRVFPDKSYTLVCLGESYLWLNETEKAENCFNAALQLDPESKEDIEYVKECFAEKGKKKR